MAIEFKKATKSSARLRMALTGVSGSGKTYTALRIASAMSDKVAVIDTERGSASKYAGIFDFCVLELEEFSPESYTAAIKAAESAGFEVLVIDSFSHAWMGKGGILDLHERATNADKKGDSFRAWGKVTPKHNELLDAILSARMHVIATMRSKSEYAISPDPSRPGKNKVEKIGMAPVQRQDSEYEFDIVGNLDQTNTLFIEKTRCSELADRSFQKPGEDVAAILTNWLSVDGKPIEDKPRTEAPKDGDSIPLVKIVPTWATSKQKMFETLNLMSEAGMTLSQAKSCLPEGCTAFSAVMNHDYDEVTERLSVMLDAQRQPTLGDLVAA